MVFLRKFQAFQSSFTYLVAGDCDTECGQEEGETEELRLLVATTTLLVNRSRRKRDEWLERFRRHPLLISSSLLLLRMMMSFNVARRSRRYWEEKKGKPPDFPTLGSIKKPTTVHNQFVFCSPRRWLLATNDLILFSSLNHLCLCTTTHWHWLCGSHKTTMMTWTALRRTH